MANYDNVQRLISEIAGQHNTMGVPRVFCKFMGSLEGGVFLSQLIYWSDKGSRKDGWFYKTYEEWEDETMLSKYKVRSLSQKLEEMGILHTTVKRANGVPTVHYRLESEKFHFLLVKFLTPESEEISQSLTDTTTTETTTKYVADSETESAHADEIQAAPPPTPQAIHGLSDTTYTEEAALIVLSEAEPVTTRRRAAGPGNAHFVALAEVCRIDLSLATNNQKQQLGQSAKLLRDKAKVAPAEIARFGAWWYAEDWRGKKGQAPTPAQVREEWARFTAGTAAQRGAGGGLRCYGVGVG